MDLKLKKFRKAYQNEVRELILSGLKEHWGVLNPNYNKDLDDIFNNYCNDIFLTAWYDNKLVGTGAAVLLNENKAQIVRMSVHKNFRRMGIGSIILKSLILELKKISVNEIILETTETWKDIIIFYREFGFEITHKVKDDVYFMLKI